jgi:hypothetical protein
LKQVLYLKTHNKTGKKYLGQTTRDPYTYKGSGTLWNKHLDKHGNDVTTQVLFESSDAKLFQKTALEYSKKFNVVNNREFLNLIDEDGGNLGGTANPNYKDGMLVGQHDNPEIRKRADKIRNAERHASNPKRGQARMKARYYLVERKIPDEQKAREWFDIWVDEIRKQPPSTKGNYKKKIPTWEDWKTSQHKSS